eukprot:6182051-Pleurochrysis_carterae.AAC.6
MHAVSNMPRSANTLSAVDEQHELIAGVLDSTVSIALKCKLSSSANGCIEAPTISHWPRVFVLFAHASRIPSRFWVCNAHGADNSRHCKSVGSSAPVTATGTSNDGGLQSAAPLDPVHPRSAPVLEALCDDMLTSHSGGRLNGASAECTASIYVPVCAMNARLRSQEWQTPAITACGTGSTVRTDLCSAYLA